MDVDVELKQLLVGDLMTIDPIVVAVDESIEEAARLMHANSITGVPVVDSFGALVGVISQTDIVGILDSRIGRVIRNNTNGLRVGELMSSPALTVAMTGSVEEAARLMVGLRIHRLVATDEAGRPVGVVSAIDLVRIFVGP